MNPIWTGNNVDTLICLDVDGVLNAFADGGQEAYAHTSIGPWPIRYQASVISDLRRILTTDGVVAAWLTTWVKEPDYLDQLEAVLDLGGVVPLRAPYPDRTNIGPGRIFAPGVGLDHRNEHWWKYQAAEELLRQQRPRRWLWADDQLGRIPGKPGRAWRPGRSPSRLLLRPTPTTGLTQKDLHRVQRWLRKG